MENILDIIFNVFYVLFLLLGLAGVIFGIFFMFKPSFLNRQSPILENVGFRFLGIALAVMGLELFITAVRYLFSVDWLDTQFLIGGGAIFVFFAVLGISTIAEQPFFATRLMPETKSKRYFLGTLFIFVGLFAFLTIADDYFGRRGNILRVYSLFPILLCWLFFQFTDKKD